MKQTPRPTVRRCPACGHRLTQPPPRRCPLCNFEFGDDRVTGVDVTPYALFYAHGERGWRTMSEWVWFAGWERLKHLALVRASAASKRFAWMNVFLLAVGLGVFRTTLTGWRWVTDRPELEPTGSTQPVGYGWLHAAAAPLPLPPDLAPETYVALWWNPVQAIIAVTTGITVGLVLMWLIMAVTRAGITRAHKPPFRDEQRMTAAIHYSTAWGLPIFVAALAGAFRPLSLVGEISQWSWCPHESVFMLPASAVAGFGAAMWWFWLIRLGTTAPARTRGRVVAFFTVGVPLILGAAIAIWWWGLSLGHQHLFTLIGLDF